MMLSQSPLSHQIRHQRVSRLDLTCMMLGPAPLSYQWCQQRLIKLGTLIASKRMLPRQLHQHRDAGIRALVNCRVLQVWCAGSRQPPMIVVVMLHVAQSICVVSVRCGQQSGVCIGRCLNAWSGVSHSSHQRHHDL